MDVLERLTAMKTTPECGSFKTITYKVYLTIQKSLSFPGIVTSREDKDIFTSQ